MLTPKRELKINKNKQISLILKDYNIRMMPRCMIIRHRIK